MGRDNDLQSKVFPRRHGELASLVGFTKTESTYPTADADYFGADNRSSSVNLRRKCFSALLDLRSGMSTTHPYHGRRVALATKHGKLAQIGPALRAAVSLEVVPVDLDTDMFGTFTGEIARPGDTLHTAIAKAEAAAHAGMISLGVASEGSFGPHPGSPFVSANLEIVVLVDLDIGCHIAEQVLTTNTNFAHVRLTPDQSPDDFAHSVGFPTHALVVQPSVGPGTIIKGITDDAELKSAITASAAASPDGQALVQTDMRAHCNPTRQLQIAEAANKLAKRLTVLCPACGAPGWGQVETKAGLPCEICGWPTNFTLTIINGCAVCSFREAHDLDEVAKASYCPMCNP